MKKLLYSVILIAVYAIFITGCGGGGEVRLVDGSSSDQLMITSSNITNGATNVALDTAISVTFNEDIEPATVTPDTFTLQRGDIPVAGPVSYDESNRTATFTPSSNLSLITTYTFTLTTGIKSISGNSFPADDKRSFTSRDGVWGTPVLIETIEGSAQPFSRLAVNSNGNAVAAWTQLENNVQNLWANRFDASTNTWGTPVRVDNSNDNDWDQNIAIDTNGNAAVVWRQATGNSDDIYGACFLAASNSWTAPVEIDAAGIGIAEMPAIAMNADGDAIAVWYQIDGGVAHIYSSRLVSKEFCTWGAAVLVENDAVQNAYNPKIAMDNYGNAMTVWLQLDGATGHVWANYYTAGLGWIPADAGLIEFGIWDSLSPDIIIDGLGNYTASWVQNDGNLYNILANRSGGGAWSTPLLVGEKSGIAPFPRMAADASGNITIVWLQPDQFNVQRNVFANRYDPAADLWNMPEAIQTGNIDVVGAPDPQIAMDNNGNAIAIWFQNDPNNIWSIYYNRFVNGAGWSTQALVETNAERAGFPQIAIDQNGRAVAIWRQGDDPIANVWASRFE